MTLELGNREKRVLEIVDRPIKLITRGHRAGAIKRLVRPSHFGELVKPFVLLDTFDAVAPADPLAGWHPHSGVGMLTFLLEGSMAYRDTTGADRILETGGVEWVRAAAGAWHSRKVIGDTPVRGFQVGIAMPPRVENALAESRSVPRAEVPLVDGARVLLGHYRGEWSPVASPGGMTLLYVELRRGQKWTYLPMPGHTVAWACAVDGTLSANGTTVNNALAIFEESDAPIDFFARSDVGFALGSAVRTSYPLVLGPHSVHTSPQNLQLGEAEIARIGARMGLSAALVS